MIEEGSTSWSVLSYSGLAAVLLVESFLSRFIWTRKENAASDEKTYRPPRSEGTKIAPRMRDFCSSRNRAQIVAFCR
jgi:hypothetical protein